MSLVYIESLSFLKLLKIMASVSENVILYTLHYLSLSSTDDCIITEVLIRCKNYGA